MPLASSPQLRIDVSQQFQRSIQLDIDIERADALAGYICQPSARSALSIIARHINNSQQRAFTWTGPYGGGKSTLALALGQLAGGTPAMRQRARQALNIEGHDEIWTAFGSRKPWRVLPVVGRRHTAEEAIGLVIDQHAPQRGPKSMRGGKRNVVAELVRRAANSEHGGVLLILDELGKLLEAAAATGDDIYLFQELAEAASRSRGKLVIVGVLHQAFEQYVARSGRETQSEWAKVQGRFVDIPVVAGTDEVIDLIGGAVQCSEPHPSSRAIALQIAQSIQLRRPASARGLTESLDRCWPLHPVTAALLGPCSRRRFGQNERSVFGFLNSSEPYGFRDFLATQKRRSVGYYDPAHFWQYLRANFEPAILASADGHRWATSAEAVERAEGRFPEPHVSLVKTIGLIELFRNGSGLAASIDVLAVCVDGYSRESVATALSDLTNANVLIYRRHSQAWGIYAGSDFDIDAAIEAVKRESACSLREQLKHLAVLPPITARKHYSETGTLRWFERVVTTPDNAAALAEADRNGTAGRFMLLVPNANSEQSEIHKAAHELSAKASPLDLFGVPKGHHRLAEFAEELAALEHVAAHNSALEGDSVARRELSARLEQLRGNVEGSLRESFAHATWYSARRRFDSKAEDGLFPIASKVCDRIFDQAPHVFSELVNRDSLSSNAAKAQRLLMHRMLTHGTQAALGYDAFPADAGLYFTTIAKLGLHRTVAGQGRYVSPEDAGAEAKSVTPLWRAWHQRLVSSRDAIALTVLSDIASSPPFGVKRGLLPILLLTFLLTHRSEIALYVDGVFAPELSASDIDEWLQDSGRVTWKWVPRDVSATQLLSKLAARLQVAAGRTVAADPLDSARALVSIAFALPEWTQRTSRLSLRAREALTLLLRASDPIKVIFTDLPQIFGTGGDIDALVDSVGEIVEELNGVYPRVLSQIDEKLLSSINHRGSLPALQARAKVVQGISGDLRLDAFATRLTLYSSSMTDVESLVSLAVNKPPRDLNDTDIDLATMQLARWAFDFRRVEAMARVQGRPANRRALAVVFADGDTHCATLDIAAEDAPQIRQLRDDLLDRARSGNIDSDVFLAALAEVGCAMIGTRQHE